MRLLLQPLNKSRQESRAETGASEAAREISSLKVGKMLLQASWYGDFYQQKKSREGDWQRKFVLDYYSSYCSSTFFFLSSLRWCAIVRLNWISTKEKKVKYQCNEEKIYFDRTLTYFLSCLQDFHPLKFTFRHLD